MDQLESMRTFVRVIEAGSFAGVARQLDVSRSVVTRQVADLERRLGTRLIARSTRRLALTAEGAAYLDGCREILDLVEAAESALERGARPSLKGRLRIGAPLSFGVRHVMPVIADFVRDHAGVEVEIAFSDRSVNLIEEGMDLAIRITATPSQTTVVRRLGSCRSVVVASPDYLARRGEPAHPHELAGHACFGYVPSSRSSWAFEIDGALAQVPVHGRLSADNGDALLQPALRGEGIVCQPTFITHEAVRAGTLKVILAAFPTPELGIYAVYPGNRFVPHRVRALVDLLAERIGGPAPWDAPDAEQDGRARQP